MEWLAGKSSRLGAAAFLMLGATLILGAGCAQPPVAAPIQAPPVAAVPPPVLSPEDQRRKAEAEQNYVTCLLNAAYYADDRKSDAAAMAIVIAPMCYPQFASYEAAASAGLSNRARFQFERTGDRLQMDFATDTIAKERSAR